MAFATLNGQELFFEDTQGTGPAVFFMHGFLLDQSMFNHQVDELKGEFRCVRWDARGFGQTRWDGKAFSLNDSVIDCFSLMDHLKIDSAFLVGMSQGGYCALRAALHSPSRVKGLVLMSTRSGVDEEPVRAAYRGMRDLWCEAGPVQPLIDGLATAILGPKEAPGMQAHWDYWLPKWRQVSKNSFFHAMNNLLDREEISHRLSEIRCPALVTHGSDDTAIPVELGQHLKESLSGCDTLVVSPGAHAPNLTHPERINPALIQFLRRNSPN